MSDRHLVLVGGGHTHALVLLAWAKAPLPGVALTVINPAPTAPYSGMLPGFVAGHYQKTDLDIDLRRLAKHAGARLVIGRAQAVDRAARLVALADADASIPYDCLSIDVGVTSTMPTLPGFADHAVPAKPLDRFAANWAGFADHPPARPAVVVLGGGVAGVELAMAAHHRLTQAGQRPTVQIVEKDTALTAVPARSRARLIRALENRGISLITHCAVTAIGPESVTLADGRILPSALTIGAGGARPHPWIATQDWQCEYGYLTVDPYLRSLSDPNIFGAGDCVHLAHAPRPKAGVYAVRAAPVLARNLKAALTDSPLHRFEPQGDYLKLISLGAKSALAEKWGLTAAGPLMWRWKDRIDRRFMAQFHALAPV